VVKAAEPGWLSHLSDAKNQLNRTDENQYNSNAESDHLDTPPLLLGVWIGPGCDPGLSL